MRIPTRGWLALICLVVAALAASCSHAPAVGHIPPIIYESDCGFARCIFAMEPDGSGVIELADPGGMGAYKEPDWSPDGTRIAFMTPEDDNYDIYVMNTDGTGRTRLTTDPAFDGYPDWSPDGSQIAFDSDRGEGGEIYVMNADGSNVRQVTDSRMSAGNPVWSPDGSRLAFTCEVSGESAHTYSICVINADGSGQEWLTSQDMWASSPEWSPDGQYIAYTSTAGDYDYIYVMKADGSEQTRVTEGSVSDWAPVWSPDGSRIAFERYEDSWDICVVNADGSGLQCLTDSGSYDGSPDWRH